MKIAVAMPSMHMCHTDFAVSLAMLVSNTKHDVCIINEKNSVIHKARHKLVQAALGAGADKILFVDTDMTFPGDIIDRLAGHCRAIVGTNASTRTLPAKPTCVGLDDKYIDIKSEELMEVKRVGMGCVLVDLKVFKKIGEPYFDAYWNGNEFVGEDYNFCDKAKENGYEIYCDCKASKEIGHLGQQVFKL